MYYCFVLHEHGNINNDSLLGIRYKEDDEMIELILVGVVFIIILVPIYLERRRREKDKQREARDYLALVEFLKSEQVKDEKYLRTREKLHNPPMKDKDGWTIIYKIGD